MFFCFSTRATLEGLAARCHVRKRNRALKKTTASARQRRLHSVEGGSADRDQKTKQVMKKTSPSPHGTNIFHGQAHVNRPLRTARAASCHRADRRSHRTEEATTSGVPSRSSTCLEPNCQRRASSTAIRAALRWSIKRPLRGSTRQAPLLLHHTVDAGGNSVSDGAERPHV